MRDLKVDYVGLKSYNSVLKQQELIFNTLLKEKKDLGHSLSTEELILCQHKAVYTLGKNGNMENLLPLAKNSGADFIKSSRGGDITFHGPGQLVGYPIIDLERKRIGLAQYINLLEECIILTIKEFDIIGSRYEGASGVWLDVKNPRKIRKICAIGIRSSRWVTMHGFALNVTTDLQYFDWINPCGFQDKGVTSMQKELGDKVDFESVMKVFIEQFHNLFGFKRPDDYASSRKNA